MRDYRAYPSSRRKQEMLSVTEDYLNRFLAALHDIQSGASESYACEKHNIDKSAFRRLVFAQKTGFQYDAKYPKTMDEYGVPDTTQMEQLGFLSWQEKLFLDCFPNMDYLSIPPDINDSMAYVFNPDNKFLTEREVDVLLYRYEKGMTCAETGKELNVTQERIRQIEAKALRRIRSGKATKYLMYGVPYIEALDSLRSQRYQAVRNKELEDLQEQFDTLGKSHDRERAYSLLNAVKAFIDENFKDEENEGNVSIDVMDFSVRIYNCLRRAGIKDLNDLRKTSYKDLRRIRNMGPRGIIEIADKVRRYGVEIEEG